MSTKGIKTFAGILSQMQETRQVLLAGDNEDIALGQLLETGKDAMQPSFLEITMGKYRKQTCKN